MAGTILEPEFSSGYVADRLDAGRMKLKLFLSVGAKELAAQELLRMTKTARYHKANFPSAALARGPIPR